MVEPENTAEFGCIVSFPDQSEAFVLGYEAGILQHRMTLGEAVIENDVPYHAINRLLFERMCTAFGYEAEFEPCDGFEGEWMTVVFTKRRAHLKVVK